MKRFRILILIVLVTFLLAALVACADVNPEPQSNSASIHVIKTIQIEFDTQGGNEIESQLMFAGRRLTQPAIPAKDGFIFAGWYTSINYNEEFSFLEPINDSTTIYAKWLPINEPTDPVDHIDPTVFITISFDTNGGSDLSALVIEQGSIPILSNPNRTGCFVFRGWYTDKQLIRQYDNSKILDSITLFAAWDEAHNTSALDSTTVIAATCTQTGYTGDFKCGVCGEITQTGSTVDALGHSYKIDESSAHRATCTENGLSGNSICERCQAFIAGNTIPATGHTWDDGVYIKQSTSCTEESIIRYTCTICSQIKDNEISPTGHIPSGIWGMDESGHWQICTNCDIKLLQNAHTATGTTHTDGDCLHYGYSQGTCTDCGYIITTTDAVYGDHYYIGYVCFICEDDSRAQIVSEFANSGDTASDLIEIDSRDELIEFMNWIYNEFPNDKFFKLTYLTGSESTTSNYSNELQTAANLRKGGYWDMSYSTYFNQDLISYCKFNLKKDTYDQHAKDTASNVVTTVANDYEQQMNIIDSPYPNTRGADFNNFEYLNRKNPKTVTYSDQLFYSLQNGYKPIPVAGSSAEEMLDKAKDILRIIIDDNMDEIEKLFAIYCWLIKDVYYDYAAIEYSNTNSWIYCDAWYLEGIFNNGVGICDAISKVFVTLANIEGIPCVRVISTNHAWNKVYVDGNGDGKREWYCIDATWANQSFSISEKKYEVFSFYDFMFTDSQKSAVGQTALTFTEYVADTMFNPYDYLTLNATTDIDLYIEDTSTELINLMKEIKATYESLDVKTQYATIEFVIVGGTTTVVKEAMAQIGWDIAYLINSQYTSDYGKSSYIITMFF